MHASHVIKVSIDRPYKQVYDFLLDPLNFPRWAANPDSDIRPMGGNDYLVDLPVGKRVIRFSPRNPFGVLDYEILNEGKSVGPAVPVRLYRNGDGCDLTLFWLKRDGVTDEQFASDCEWVTSDLTRLKCLLEEDD
jgi:hypothetical protein